VYIGTAIMLSDSLSDSRHTEDRMEDAYSLMMEKPLEPGIGGSNHLSAPQEMNRNINTTCEFYYSFWGIIDRSLHKKM